jgi:hypothetical protein
MSHNRSIYGIPSSIYTVTENVSCCNYHQDREEPRVI